MHFHALLEPQLDAPDVAPVVQRISFECEKTGLVAFARWMSQRLRIVPTTQPASGINRRGERARPPARFGGLGAAVQFEYSLATCRATG